MKVKRLVGFISLAIISNIVAEKFEIIDETKYPVNDLESGQGMEMIRKARSSFEQRGVAWFPNFILEEALLNAVTEVRVAASNTAFITDEKHNAYQLGHDDYSLSANHVRNKKMRTRVASIAYADLSPHGVLRRLYASPGLLALVRAVTNRTNLFRLADPLGAASVNVFRNSWQHAWHYDESEFTITLSLQQADRGGHFELTAPLRKRNSSDLAFENTAAIINAHSLYNVTPRNKNSSSIPAVEHAPFEPGTLQIFAGRHSLHRVSPSWGRDRLVAVFCFADHRGFINSPQVQFMFWGRVDQQPRKIDLDDTSYYCTNSSSVLLDNE